LGKYLRRSGQPDGKRDGMGTIHGFSYQVRNEIALSLLPPIDGDGLFGIRSAAGADNAG
jgi:hypothetical protein